MANNKRFKPPDEDAGRLKMQVQHCLTAHAVEFKLWIKEAYLELPEPNWGHKQIETCIKKLFESRLCKKFSGEWSVLALPMGVQHARHCNNHTQKQIAGNSSSNLHHPEGETLFGIGSLIKRHFRGMGFGRSLNNYRKDLYDLRWKPKRTRAQEHLDS